MTGIISTRVHGVLDYLGGILVAASPWIFGFEPLGGAALFIPLVFGCMTLVMTIFTKHEMGLIKVFPFQLHLILDAIVGFILLVSPFLYQFYHHVFLPHVLLGLFLLGSAIYTEKSPFLDDKLNVFDPRGM